MTITGETFGVEVFHLRSREVRSRRNVLLLCSGSKTDSIYGCVLKLNLYSLDFSLGDSSCIKTTVSTVGTPLWNTPFHFNYRTR